MRVSWLLPNLHPTGGSRVAVELTNKLIEKNHKCSILIPSGRNRFNGEIKATVIECGIKVKSPLLAVATGVLSMKQNLPATDIIVASMPPYALIARIIGSDMHLPSVNYVLNDDVHFFDDGSYFSSRILLQLYRFIARRSIRNMNIFVNSHWTAVQCVAEGGDKSRAIVPHGFNTEFFSKIDFRPETNTNTFILVTIGRSAYWKGFRDLISALNSIVFSDISFKLKVITQENLDCSDAKFDCEIVSPANDAELVELYREGDLFLHSSWFEGFGMPPLEAMACGLPVIATDSGGVKEFLIDGVNSVLVPPREPDTLGKEVIRLLKDGSKRQELAENGWKASRKFTWDESAERFEKSLIEIIENG